MLPTTLLAERQAGLRATNQAGGGRRGRPRLPLDPVQIFELALLGLSNRQIAAQLGCDHKTLGRFAADLQRARVRRQTLLQLEEMRLVVEEGSWAALQTQLKRLPRGSGSDVFSRPIIPIIRKHGAGEKTLG